MPQIQQQQITRPQRRRFCVTKYQIRLLLGRGEGVPMAETTWHRFWKAQELPQKLGMSESQFSRSQVFYLDDFQKLKKIIGFDDADLFDL